MRAPECPFVPRAPDHLYGLPGPLPPGERVLWMGSPRFRPVAVHLFRIRLVGLYFVGLAAVAVAAMTANGAPVGDAVLATLIAATPLVAVALGLILAGAALVAQTTTYFVTDRRVVLLVGVAITKIVNIPLARISDVALRGRRDGTSDVALTLTGGRRLSYLALFPHVRVRSLGWPQPLLRALPDGEGCAAALVEALSRPAERRRPAPAPAAANLETAGGAHVG